MKQSLTISGLAVIVLTMVFEPGEAQTLVDSTLVIIDKVGVIAGILMTYYGRYRQGDINLWGQKLEAQQ